MQLTAKLLRALNRVFDKDARPFLALRLSYQGGLTWQVADGILTTAVTGGPGAPLAVDLSAYTITSLVGFLAAQPGYIVPYADSSDLAQLSALVLVDGSGDIGQSNGDHLQAYTNPNWAFLDAAADQLTAAQTAIAALPAEMSTTSADGEWLDLLGSYYGVPRNLSEVDAQYGPRITGTVLQPRSNNIAIAMALTAATGQACQVPDVVEYGAAVPQFDGTITYDGAHTYSTAAKPIYGLFDVTTGYDLLGATTPTAFVTRVQQIVAPLRAAGTQLRAVALQGGTLVDAGPAPADALPVISVQPILADSVATPADTSSTMPVALTGLIDAATPPQDSTDALLVAFSTTFNGVRRFDGSVLYASGHAATESMAGVVSGTV